MPYTGQLPEEGQKPWYTPFKTAWDGLVTFVNGLETRIDEIGPAVDPTWDDVQDKPTTFPPAAHTQDIASITGLQTALDGKASSQALADFQATAAGEIDDLSDEVATKATQTSVDALSAAQVTMAGNLDATFTLATEAQADATTALSDATAALSGATAAQEDADAALLALPLKADKTQLIITSVLEPGQVPPAPGVYLRKPTVAFVGAFDAFGAPHRAHSLRRILSSYSGPLVKVRRSSDNATQDIGYLSDGSLDTAALLTFVGSGDGYVETFYDQGPTGRHLTQATAGNQPRIVSAGVLDAVAGKPTLIFDGTTDVLVNATAGLFAATTATVVAVMKAASSAPSNATLFSESRSTSNNGFWRSLRGSAANWNVQATDDSGAALWASTAAGSNLFDTLHHQATYIEGSGLINTWRDNVQAHSAIAATRGGTTTPNQTALGAHVGSAPSNYYGGAVQELVAWTSAQTANRASIQTAQKGYWGTP